jgi:hypothetical protein
VEARILDNLSVPRKSYNYKCSTVQYIKMRKLIMYAGFRSPFTEKHIPPKNKRVLFRICEKLCVQLGMLTMHLAVLSSSRLQYYFTGTYFNWHTKWKPLVLLLRCARETQHRRTPQGIGESSCHTIFRPIC